MAEYIPKQAAIDAMKQLPHEYGTKEQRARTGGIAACQMVVRNLDAADVRPVVRGRWEQYESCGGFWDACSVCGADKPMTRFNTHYYAKFCPNCGADMQGGDAE